MKRCRRKAKNLVKQKFCINETDTSSIIASDFVGEQLMRITAYIREWLMNVEEINADN